MSDGVKADELDVINFAAAYLILSLAGTDKSIFKVKSKDDIVVDAVQEAIQVLDFSGAGFVEIAGFDYLAFATLGLARAKVARKDYLVDAN